MRGALAIVCLFALAVSARATEPTYPSDLQLWQEVSLPPNASRADRVVWSLAVNRSPLRWRVWIEDGRACAELFTGEPQQAGERPAFRPEVGSLQRVASVARVDGGWLVGFNEGEFGAAIYWFSSDGTRNYKVSNHHVESFFTLPSGLYAVEGLAHRGSRGAVIRLSRVDPNDNWQATSVVELPAAPLAIAQRRDNTVFVVVTNALVQLGTDYTVTNLVSGRPWSGANPHSLVLSSDEQKLFIGMSQFVGEFDIPTNRFRLLIPSLEFLNRLPADEEADIRREVGE